MRPLYGVIRPKIKRHYTRLRHSLTKLLHGSFTDTDTEMQPSVQKVGSDDGRDWGLRVPGSQTMKTIDLHVSRTHNSDRGESNDIFLSDNKSNKRVVEDWV